MKAWIALGGNQEPIQFDFAKWLEGQDVEIERIMGEVDTDLPFVHMDERSRLVSKMSLYKTNMIIKLNGSEKTSEQYLKLLARSIVY